MMPKRERTPPAQIDALLFVNFNWHMRSLFFFTFLFIATSAIAADFPQAPGEYTLTLTHADRERSYILHLPPQYDGHKALPLVLAFHGGGGNARQLLDSNHLTEVADREGFILVAPNGSGRFRHKLLTWNVGFGFGYAMKHGIDDIGFVGKLLDELEGKLSIDSRRIHATGISNGGFLCHFLAGHFPNRIAAIAPIVASIGGKKKASDPMIVAPIPSSPVAVIAFNGGKDEHIPYKGGKQIKSAGKAVYVASAAETHRFWIKANHCGAIPKTENDPTGHYRVITFNKGCKGHEVVQYLIHDQGHAWPGGTKPRFFADKPSPYVSADEVMWAFFKNHPK